MHTLHLRYAQRFSAAVASSSSASPSLLLAAAAATASAQWQPGGQVGCCDRHCTACVHLTACGSSCTSRDCTQIAEQRQRTWRRGRPLTLLALLLRLLHGRWRRVAFRLLILRTHKRQCSCIVASTGFRFYVLTMLKCMGTILGGTAPAAPRPAGGSTCACPPCVWCA